MSDHNILILDVETQKASKVQNKLSLRTRINFHKLNQYLEQNPLSYSSLDVCDMYDEFVDHVQRGLNRCRIVSKSFGNQKESVAPWMDLELSKLSKTKNYLHGKWKKFPINIIIKEEYIACRNAYTNQKIQM